MPNGNTNNGMGVKVGGLYPLLRELKGRTFRDVNSALRDEARWIGDQIVPEVQAALRLSGAPQAPAFDRTVKSKRDRIPMVVIGATNPSLSKFSRRGARKDGSPRMSGPWRRGALAHGIVYGPQTSGPRAAPKAAGKQRKSNVYGTRRDDSGGRVMASIHRGRAYRGAADAYRAAYRRTLRKHGFKVPREAY